jgi:hypothetical protein
LRTYDQEGGCPKMKSICKSERDCWHGFTPSNFRDEGGSITNIFIPPIFDKNANSVPEDLALQIADVVSDHDLLQSRIKSEVSQALQDHDLELPKKEAEPDTLDCVFDFAEHEKKEDLYLLEILCKVKGDEHPYVSEGLVLTPVQDDTMYARVGFFVYRTVLICKDRRCRSPFMLDDAL